MQLTLTDYEANLVERALRRQTRTFSDMDNVTVKRIADRMLRQIIHAPVKPASSARLNTEGAGYIFASGDKDFLRGDMSDRRWQASECTGTVTRQTDEYACSCGARWDVLDGEVHP